MHDEEHFCEAKVVLFSVVDPGRGGGQLGSLPPPFDNVYTFYYNTLYVLYCDAATLYWDE